MILAAWFAYFTACVFVGAVAGLYAYDKFKTWNETRRIRKLCRALGGTGRLVGSIDRSPNPWWRDTQREDEHGLRFRYPTFEDFDEKDAP